MLSALTRALIDEPYEIITASGGSEALALMEGKSVKVIEECDAEIAVGFRH